MAESIVPWNLHASNFRLCLWLPILSPYFWSISDSCTPFPLLLESLLLLTPPEKSLIFFYVGHSLVFLITLSTLSCSTGWDTLCLEENVGQIIDCPLSSAWNFLEHFMQLQEVLVPTSNVLQALDILKIFKRIIACLVCLLIKGAKLDTNEMCAFMFSCFLFLYWLEFEFDPCNCFIVNVFRIILLFIYIEEHFFKCKWVM